MDYASCDFDWNKEKEKILQQTRGISFHTIVKAIKGGNLITIIDHYNPEKYPHQKIFVVVIE
jgi:hypothetical protein